MEHTFTGKWITTEEFARLAPRNIFHRQLEKVDLPCTEHRDRHILFRRRFSVSKVTGDETVFITADDYFKLYVNGRFVCQGPAPSYHFQYNYLEVPVSAFLQKGENVIAVHTLYQGLINRVWQSGDLRHGLLLDLVQGGRVILSSDESFLTAVHGAYSETGVVGYDTQFLERYDSRAPEVGFEALGFDDSTWEKACVKENDDHVLVSQKSYSLVFEEIAPVSVKRDGNRIIIDFGSEYVGYLRLSARGSAGDCLTILCGQELNPDGSVRYKLRANCRYEEEWILSGKTDTLDWFDYKAFRYAEIVLPDGAELVDVSFLCRHYPFDLAVGMRPAFGKNESLRKIWDLCVRTQKYGVQEVIQDCMEREKGFYLGDGCYTALTQFILTKDDTMLRKLIDDGFSSERISDTLLTCMDGSMMQEIAEYPLILISTVLWHYRLTKDKEYLAQNAPKAFRLLDAYRHRYEKDGLLRDLDRWCVVEWPANFRQGYDVNIEEGKVCHEAHVSINAYYLEAIRSANKIARLLGIPDYRDEKPVLEAFLRTFYDIKRHVFRDGENTDHVCPVGNAFPYAFSLFPDKEGRDSFLEALEKDGIEQFSFFCTFPVLTGLVREGRYDLLEKCLASPGAWLRILAEGGTVTFEGWGRDTKWNTSLFHMTLSFAATFLADVDLEDLFR